MYAYRQNILSRESQDKIINGVEGSGLIGKSQLGPQFKGTNGFSVVFRDDGTEEFKAQLPWLQPYFDAIRFPASNSFYINLLSMRGGARVDPHIDMRVLQTAGQVIIPNLVSVYYLKTPPVGRGGDIVFYFADSEIKKTPIGNDMVIFQGNVWHSVTAVDGDCERVSIVCEQYNLTSTDQDQFPKFVIYHEQGKKDENPRVTEVARAA